MRSNGLILNKVTRLEKHYCPGVPSWGVLSRIAKVRGVDLSVVYGTTSSTFSYDSIWYYEAPHISFHPILFCLCVLHSAEGWIYDYLSILKSFSRVRRGWDGCISR